jgi:hypothetical protein
VKIITSDGSFTAGHGGMLEFQNEDVITAGIRGIRESGWGSGMAFYVHNTSSGNTFNSTFVERMRIDEDGNLGIGTTNPGTKLDVDGDIFLSESGRLQGRAYPYNTTVGSGADAATSTIEAGSTAGYRSRIALAGGSATDPNTIKFLTTSAERMRIFSSGNVFIGSSPTDAGYKLDVNGNTNITGTLTATIKSFIIDHPTKQGKKLQYGVLEGPEHSVYVRGRLTNENTIVLPDHWHGLVHEDTITVNLTSIGKKQDLWVEEVNAHEIKIGSENEINCFYTVFAERKDIEKLVTEFDK